MPSPLTFFKTLANQKGKVRTSQDPESGYRPKGKLRKPSIRYPASHTNAELETNNAEFVDRHPEQLIEDDGSAHDHPYHPSIPEGNVEAWRKFPPAYRVESVMTHNSHRLPRQSSAPSENPVVSRYYSAAHAVQPPPREPIPPSRTWSTIPSVRRESEPQRGHEADTVHDQKNDLHTISHPQNTPFAQTTPSRRSTVRTIGQLPSIHERRLLEYPKQQQVKPSEQRMHSGNSSAASVSGAVRSNKFARTLSDEGREPEIYHYIVPSGIEVIFEDEAGTEITRVGTDVIALNHTRPLKSAPIVVQDEFGRVLYQDVLSSAPSGGSRRPNYNDHDRSESGQNSFGPEGTHARNMGNRHFAEDLSSPSSLLSSNSTKLIMIDKGGHQIPIRTTANLLGERSKEQRQHPVSGSHHPSISR